MKAEAEGSRSGDAREVGALLGDHHGSRHPVGHHVVEALEKGHRLQVLVAAVNVGYPVGAREIEVEHRGHRVHPQTVDVVFLQPLEGRADQEHHDLVASVIEDIGVPVEMKALARIGVLEQRAAVEVGQAVLVGGEVARHPVEQHPDAARVQVIDEILEIVGRAEAAGGRVVAGHLVAPRTVEGVLHDAHQFDVGVAEPVHVIGQAVRQIAVVHVPVAQAACPRPQMHLVDADRLLVAVVAPGHPVAVVPDVAALPDDAGGGGAQFRALHVRIGFLDGAPVLAGDVVLVGVPGAGLRHEKAPEAEVEALQRVLEAVPVIEVAHHADMLGVGGPHGETDALHTVLGGDVRAQQLIGPAPDRRWPAFEAGRNSAAVARSSWQFTVRLPPGPALPGPERPGGGSVKAS